MLIPITMVWFVNGLQPVYVFLYGILLTLIFPRISKEDLSKKVLFQKLAAILVMFVGAYLINRS